MKDLTYLVIFFLTVLISHSSEAASFNRFFGITKVSDMPIKRDIITCNHPHNQSAHFNVAIDPKVRPTLTIHYYWGELTNGTVTKLEVTSKAESSFIVEIEWKKGDAAEGDLIPNPYGARMVLNTMTGIGQVYVMGDPIDGDREFPLHRCAANNF